MIGVLRRWDVLAAIGFVAVLAAIPVLISTQQAKPARPAAIAMQSDRLPTAVSFAQVPPAGAASAAAAPAYAVPAAAPAPGAAPAPPSKFIQPHQAVEQTLLVSVPRPDYLPPAAHRGVPAGLNGKTGPLITRAVADLPELALLGAGEFRRMGELPLAVQASPDPARMGVVAPTDRPAAERPPITEDPTRGRWQQNVTPAILSPRRGADLRYGQLRSRGMVDPPELALHASAAPDQAPSQPILPLAQALSPDISAPIGPGIQAPNAEPATVSTDPTSDQSRESALAAATPRRLVSAPMVRLSIPDPFENANNLLLRNMPSDEDPPSTSPIMPPRAAMDALPVPPAPPPPPTPKPAPPPPATPPPATPKPVTPPVATPPATPNPVTPPVATPPPATPPATPPAAPPAKK